MGRVALALAREYPPVLKASVPAQDLFPFRIGLIHCTMSPDRISRIQSECTNSPRNSGSGTQFQRFRAEYRTIK